MKERKGQRTLSRTVYSIQKRFLAFLLAAAMILTNVGADMNTIFAASSSEPVTFSMSGSQLVKAIDEAIANGEEVTAEDLDFTNGKIDEFEKLFFGEGKIYEAYPESEGGSIDAELRVFVRLPEDADNMYMVTGDEEIIFLYVNNGENTISCTTEITRMDNGAEKVKKTPRITVKSYEAAFGDEEVNVISKPAEITAPEKTTVPTATESQAKAPEETAAAPEKTQKVLPEEATAEPEETQEALPEEAAAEPEETQGVLPEETTAEPEETAAALEESQAEAPKQVAAEEETQEAAQPEETEAPAEEASKGDITEPVASIIRHHVPVVAANENGDAAETAEEPKETEAIAEEKATEAVDLDETAYEDESTAESAAETVPDVATPSESKPAAETPEPEDKVSAAGTGDLVGIGYCSAAKAYVTTINQLKAMDDFEGYKVTYSVEPEASARIEEKMLGVAEGESFTFGVKNQIGYTIQSVTVNDAENTADYVVDNEDGSQTAWYTVPEVYEEQNVQVHMSETDEHPEYSTSIMMEDGTVIHIHAAEGVLPAGVKAVASVVKGIENVVKENVEADAAAAGEVKEVIAALSYNIDLLDRDGNKLDDQIWNGAVEVTFTGTPVEQHSKNADTVEVMYVATTKEDVPQAEITAEDVLSVELVSDTVDVADGKGVSEVEFEAEHFSTYTLVFGNSSSTNRLDIQVTDTNGNSIGNGSSSVVLGDVYEKKVSDIAEEIMASNSSLNGYSFSAATVGNDYATKMRWDSRSGKAQYYNPGIWGIWGIGGSWKNIDNSTVIFKFNELPYVIFDANGGAFPDGNTEKKVLIVNNKVSQSDIPTGSNLPTMTGAAFNQWTYKSDSFSSFTRVSNGVRIYALYKSGGYNTSQAPVSDENLPEVDGIKPGNIAASKTAEWVDYDNRIGKLVFDVRGIPKRQGSDIVIVLDKSGSMSPRLYGDTNFTERMIPAKEATKALINEILSDSNNNNRVAFVPFSSSDYGSTHTSDSVNFQTSETSGPLYNAVNASDALGGTKYKDALTKAQQYITDRTTSEKSRPAYIIFISDGEDTGGNYTNVANNLKSAGVVIYGVGIQLTGNGGDLYSISSSTVNGGKLYQNVSEVEDLAPVFRKVAASIKIAGTKAVFNDVISTYFDAYQGGGYTNSPGVTVSGKNVTINVGDIIQDGTTFTIYIKIKDAYKNETDSYPTNSSVNLEYVDVDGKAQTKDENYLGKPRLSVASGSITVKYYLVNENGEYLRKNVSGGYDVVSQEYADVVSTTEQAKLTVLANGSPYNVSADVPTGFELYSGEEQSKTVTLTKDNPDQVVSFKVCKPGPVNYVVKYFYQSNGVYSAAADSTDGSRSEEAGTEVSVTEADKTPMKAGYVFDEDATGNVLSGTIAGDGSLVLKVYFKQQFAVTYSPGTHGTFTPRVTGSLNYGAATPEFTGAKTGEAGYTFAGWEPKVADQVTGNATYVAQWTANENTAYMVEYYYQSNGAYSGTADSSASRIGTTDTEALATDDDKTPKEAGYVFDEAAAGNVLSGTIAGDGSLVLKVYFKQQFTVTYNPGAHGTFNPQVTGSLNYNAATPKFTGAKTGDAGYTFAGWTPEVVSQVTGNVTYVAQWTANEDTAYTVEYYYQSNGVYSGTADDSDDRIGTTDTEAVVTNVDKAPTRIGYMFDEAAGNVLSGTIAGDGSLVLKVYFKQQFTVTYNPGAHGTFNPQVTGSLNYNAATPEFTGTKTGEAGYTFVGWEPEVVNQVTGNVTYVAQWTANEDTAYAVEYYYQSNGAYSGTADSNASRIGTTDTEALVTDDDKIPVEAGYVFDEAAGNVLSGTIAGDGSLVLKVYFKQQFAVTYNPGAHGTFTPQVIGSLDYNAATPEFTEGKTGEAGYTFAGWEPEVSDQVTGNVTYVAQWTANENTAYTVEYYYQSSGAYSAAADDSDNRTGTTDTEALVTTDDKMPTKAGYVFDEAAGNVLSGTIAGDGNLVLKVYFKQQFTVTYNPGPQGTFEAQMTGGMDYNANTPGFTGEPTGKPGYKFAGWSPKVEPVVTKDFTYEAQWIASDSTKYTVEFYYESKGKYPAQPNDSSLRAGTTDVLTTVTDADKAAPTGYILDSNAANVFEATVTGDGGTLLKVYFKQQFTVTYNPGDHGSFKAQTNTGLSYGDENPAFSGQTTANGNYSFKGWDKEIAKTVTENVVYTALWTYNGGGSSSGGGPSSSRPYTNGGPGDATVTIDPGQVPLASLPEDNSATNLVLIDDGNIPLAGLPKTGDKASVQGVAAIISGILLAAYMAISRRRRDER